MTWGLRGQPWLISLAGYGSLALVLTWPLAIHLATVVPHDLGDPLLCTWILWWNAYTMPLTSAWWNAPMFWPMSGALALSEHLLGVSLVASPLQWLGADPVTAYNIVFLLSFPLCAVAAHALAFTLTARHDAAAVAGLAFAFNPYRTSHLPHLQMLWTFWMPLALLALCAQQDLLQVREFRLQRRVVESFGLKSSDERHGSSPSSARPRHHGLSCRRQARAFD